MMMDNYPPGAAHDPQAPYNEIPEEETEVTVRTVLVKETCVFGLHSHTCEEWEYDPDLGRFVRLGFTETDGDVGEAFRDQQRSALQVIEACGRLCDQLLKDGHQWYAGMSVTTLREECRDWEEEELTIEN